MEAFVSVVAALHGPNGEIPLLFERESPDHPRIGSLAEALTTLSHADSIPAPVRLEVLAQLVRSDLYRADTFRTREVEDSVQALATSFFEIDDPGDSVRALVSRLEQSHLNADALGRTRVADLFDPDPLVAQLAQEIRDTALALFPDCEAEDVSVRGAKALSISTVVLTREPLLHFRQQVDPEEWPNCPVETLFFKSMDPVGQPAWLDPPDTGWSNTLEEVVDFGLGFTDDESQQTRTDLNFVVFGAPFGPAPKPGAPPAPQTDYDCWGCTYDLAPGGDGKITVDQGFVLVEDLQPTADARRVRTLKVVYFDGVAEPFLVCPFWGIVAGLIEHIC